MPSMVLISKPCRVEQLWVYLALDTSMLMEHYCLVVVAVYVHSHSSCGASWNPSSSAYDVYQSAFDKAAELLPAVVRSSLPRS